MVEIEVDGSFSLDEIKGLNENEVEEILHNEIAKDIVKEIVKEMENMAFIDLEIDEESNMFKYTAEIVICSKQNIITANAMMAQKLASFGLDEEDIVEVLSIQQENSGGF